MQKFIFYSICILFFSCNVSSPGPKFDVEGFAREGFGSGGEIVNYLAADNTWLAKGTMVNGVRNGTWITYYPGKDVIRQLTTYVHGKKNGVELVFSERGQIEVFTEYKNDELHGLSAKYKFGRPTEETHYKNGLMDGVFAIYSSKGIVQRSGEFKEGKQHGILQYFDEEGRVTLEYEYRDGEKISGGIVEEPSLKEEDK